MFLVFKKTVQKFLLKVCEEVIRQICFLCAQLVEFGDEKMIRWQSEAEKFEPIREEQYIKRNSHRRSHIFHPKSALFTDPAPEKRERPSLEDLP